MQRRKLYPHHNQLFYKGEFDGMTGEIIRWAPYLRFEDLVGAMFEEAMFEGVSRIP